MRRHFGFYFWLILILILIVAIFQASNTPYQQQNIQPFLRSHFDWNANTLPHVSFWYDGTLVTTQDPYAFVEFVIRKMSHVTEYAVLTFLFVNLLLTTRLMRRIAIFFGLLFPFLYACIDEFHQRFIPGRTGHLIDVITFDLAGMVIGLVLALIFRCIILVLFSSNKNVSKPRTIKK
ncbi:hypothetical protein GMB86_05850 [Terrilactibacillus sp. BCM23-1]|uniref:VanZ-like domain-containing protein n=1 Tax=Terrilactibacillus tamarindi TaxID=2599694 RepID=A0A6N8CQS6_9BACI|nr:VanZ family protein [Terrilactibacillus tamarindi]MTT31537.1 hypothetical protein [Terrilactibacillus tamarindi]